MRTWLDLEKRFRELVEPLQQMRLDAQWGAAGEYLRLAGHYGPQTKVREFEMLCGIGGRFLEQALDPESEMGKYLLAEQKSKERWYRLLVKYSGALEHGLFGFQQDDEGNDMGTIYTGHIDQPVAVSANQCLELHVNHPIDNS